jgi:cell wall-associated NlpC family hydrolase
MVRPRRSAIVAEARTWIDTPFIWQAAAKGAGADCKGLLWGVARELGLPEAESFYASVADYGKDRVPSALLKEGMAAVFAPVELEDACPGDVLLCRYRGAPAHIAILTELPDTWNDNCRRSERGSAIHTQIKSKAYVKETALRVLLAVFPLDSIWRFASCR